MISFKNNSETTLSNKFVKNSTFTQFHNKLICYSSQKLFLLFNSQSFKNRLKLIYKNYIKHDLIPNKKLSANAY
jgi:hypothetical protein